MLYIPGSDFERHYKAINDNEDIYQFMKWDIEGYQYYTYDTYEFGFNYKDWDTVYLNQVSGKAGIIGSYSPDMNNLINLVNNKGGKTYNFGLLMPWAYSRDATRPQFKAYDNNQLKMYQMVSTTVKDIYYEVNKINDVLPIGTAIQNARNTILNDIGNDLTRDTYHLEKSKARHIASLTAYAHLTGGSIDNLNNGVFTDTEYEQVINVVNKTVEQPYNI